MFDDQICQSIIEMCKSDSSKESCEKSIWLLPRHLITDLRRPTSKFGLTLDIPVNKKITTFDSWRTCRGRLTIVVL